MPETVRVARGGRVAAGWLVALLAGPNPGAAIEDSLPPRACVEALRSARLLAEAGDLEGAWSRTEAAVEGAGCELPALATLLTLHALGARGESASLEARLLERLSDPATAIPSGSVDYLASSRRSDAERSALAAALEERRRRAREEAVELGSEENATLLWQIFRLRRVNGELEAASAALDELNRSQPDLASRWNAFELDYAMGRWERVLAAADELVEEMPDAHERLVGPRMTALVELERYDDLLSELDRLAPADVELVSGELPATLGLLHDLGWRLRDAGRDAEAERVFRRAMELAPDSAVLRRVILHLYASPQERSEHAAAVAEARAAEVDPQRLFEEGTRLLAAGGVEEAYDLLARAVPGLGRQGLAAPAAWYNLGLAAFKLERWDSAAEAFGVAAGLEPSRAETHYQLGLALFQLDRCAESVPALRAALERAPERYQAHYYLARCLASLGRSEEAARERELYERSKPAG